MDSRGKVFYCRDETILEKILDVHVVDDCFWSEITAGEEESVHSITDEPMLYWLASRIAGTNVVGTP